MLELLSPGDVVPPLGSFSGLLMVGGGDIHPRYWDPAEPLHAAAQVDEERDALEIPIAREAWRIGLPILGICRGEQILNVALGGSLIQDIPSHFSCGLAVHQGDDEHACRVHHPITLDPSSRLAALLRASGVGVNSGHHQAAGRVAPGLAAVAWSKTPDGVVEAIEAEDPARWVFGVQWHPERLIGLEDATGLAARRIFDGFVRALRNWKSAT